MYKDLQDQAQMLIYWLCNLHYNPLWLRVWQLSVMTCVWDHFSMGQWRNTKYRWMQSCQITNTKGSELALRMYCNNLYKQRYCTENVSSSNKQLHTGVSLCVFAFSHEKLKYIFFKTSLFFIFLIEHLQHCICAYNEQEKT